MGKLTDAQLALLGDHAAQKRVTERGELLPCPCCGATADIGIDFDCDGYQEWNSIFCINCGLEMNGVRTINGVSKEEIKELMVDWNTRAPILTPEQIKRLEEM